MGCFRKVTSGEARILHLIWTLKELTDGAFPLTLLLPTVGRELFLERELEQHPSMSTSWRITCCQKMNESLISLEISALALMFGFIFGEILEALIIP